MVSIPPRELRLEERGSDWCAAELAAPAAGDRVLVLGFEELMYAPLRIAQALAEKHPEMGRAILLHHPVAGVAG